MTAQKLKTAVVTMSVNTSPEETQEFGCVLAQIRGPKGERTLGKSFRLDLGAFNGEIPAQHDGVEIQLTLDPANDKQTKTQRIPAAFKVLEINEGQFLSVTEPDDVEADLIALGLL